MFTESPEPGDPASLDRLLEVWPGASRIVRCHDSRFGATEFNPGIGRGRFHPFYPLQGHRRQPVPTIYGAGDFDGALSETVFHNIPVGVPLSAVERAVRRSTLKPMLVSVIAPLRDLTLVQLHGYGLPRLGLHRADLIDCEPDHYERTARWAQALHAAGDVDGLVWVSRQHDSSRALVLFGDRVARRDLAIAEPPLPLYLGLGFAQVQAAAEKAGITLFE